jgi:stage IV sporulation protein FB
MVTIVETLSPTATLDDAVTCLIRSSQKEFPVVDGAGRPRGLVTRDKLIPALRDGGPATPVLDVMTRDIPTIGAREPLERGLTVLNGSRAPALFVLNEAGQLVGLVTPENIGELMMVRSVRPDWPIGGMRMRGA